MIMNCALILYTAMALNYSAFDRYITSNQDEYGQISDDVADCAREALNLQHADDSDLEDVIYSLQRKDKTP